MVQLGAKYRDAVTGFTGTCTGHARYISGCSQALLMPPVDSTGKLVEGQWFDEQRLINLGDPVVVLDNSKTPGCDMPAPKR